jgi:hypothetical protein
MVARFAAALELPVSRVHLESYRPPGAGDITMIVNYPFNVELSEALYPKPRHDIRHAGQQHRWPMTALDVDSGTPAR